MKSKQLIVAAAAGLISIASSAQAQWSLNGVKAFYNAGNVGIGTNNPAYKLDVRTNTARAIYADATAVSGATYGVYGLNRSTTGRGVFGYANAATGANYGVQGQTSSTTGRGVYGYATNAEGENYGVYGRTSSGSGYAGYFLGGRNYFQGNVGIGTDTPGLPLVVVVNEFGLGIQTLSVDGKSDLSTFVDEDGGWIGTSNAKPLNFYTGNSSQQVTLTTDGNLGVAVIEPTHRLTVAGNARFIGNAGGKSAVEIGVADELSAIIGTSIGGVSSDIHFTEDGFWFSAAGTGNVSILANGNVGLGVETPIHPIEHTSGAHCTVGGDWTNASSRTLKENFKDVDVREVLNRVIGLPILKWNYKVEGKNVKHMGPIAEDFAAAFKLGSTDKAIGTVDASGVALASIQGLHQMIVEKEQQIAKLGASNDELQNRVASLESLVQKLIDAKVKD